MTKLKQIILLLVSLLLISCTAQPESAVLTSNPVPLLQEVQEEEIMEATVVAVGDIMFHLPQVSEARTEKGYDFGKTFEKIKELISDADIAIANFETTINEKKALSGYPRFNSPPEVLEGIRDSGFDVMVTANNHCMDTGIEGAEGTLALIKKNNMIPVGTGENKEAVIEKNGIRVGILAYTNSTNGLRAPAGFVCMTNEEQMQKDIDGLKAKCDFVIVYIHAGVEYNRGIEESTLKLFRAVADMGADCVLGSHPHVARKSELYYTGERHVLINYSMGNFLSNQNDKYTDIGSITRLNIRKKGEKTSLADFEVLPTYRLRFRDTDGKTKRRVILTSDIESYSQISESERQYIKAVQDEITMLLQDESDKRLRAGE